MNDFEKLKEYSDDELIFIVYDDKENWQKEAIVFAKQLLSERGINEKFCNKRILEIRSDIDSQLKKELGKRKVESFSILDLIFMSLFWFKYIFQDWYLKKEGYDRMYKQRLYSIGIGVILFSVMMLDMYLSLDDVEQKRIDEINQIAISDSIAKSKVNWSGVYQFKDIIEGKTESVVWQLSVVKVKTEHNAILKLTNENNTIVVPCVGLVEKNILEIYSDTIVNLLDNRSVSYHDKLFIIEKQDNGLVTHWKKLKPFNQQFKNWEAFKKK